jgi:hypothetical protein
MADQTTRTSGEQNLTVVDSTDIPKIVEQLNASIAHMSMAAENIEKHDAVDVLKRVQDPVWAAEMERHLRHFRTSKSVVEYASWMLGQAQQQRSEDAARKLSESQARLSGRLNWLTLAMVVAVGVQAVSAVAQAIFAWLAWHGAPMK